MLVKLIISVMIGIIPFQFLKKLLYKAIFGYQIDRNTYIGISIILCKRFHMGEGSRIGHFNVIWQVNDLVMQYKTVINRQNYLRGIDSFFMDSESSIGKRNFFTRNNILTKHGSFFLGKKSIVTIDHQFDLIDDIIIRENSVIAGSGSQFWTHGFDIWRNRIQGPITISANVYIGSRSLCNLNVAIARNTQIAMGSVISKSISEEGYFWGGVPIKCIKSLVNLAETSTTELSMIYDGHHFYRKIQRDKHDC